MKTSLTTKFIALGAAAVLALPLTASARPHRDADIFAGAVIGVIAGAILAGAADCGTAYVAAPPPPPPVYYYPPPPPPPPPPVCYYPPANYGCPRQHHHRPPPPQYGHHRRPHGPRSGCY